MLRLPSYIAALILLLITHTAHAQPQHWLAKKGKTELMIIGSIHVGDDSMYPLPTNVTAFLKNSDGLIVEADIRDANNITPPKPRLLARQVLDKKQRAHLKAIASEFGLNEENLLDSPPWSAALTIEVLLVNKLGYQSEQGIDMHLIELAEQNDVPLLPLETVQFQLDLIANQHDGGKELLLASMEDFRNGQSLVKCLINSWKNGDLKTIENITQHQETCDEFNDAFLYTRNRDWANKIDSGKIFSKKDGHYTLVVGSLHLIGKDNLIDLLKQRGFHIQPLGKTVPTVCDT
ncbi:TraB/GumN family protein [Vibrio sagamiensis]|uniref:GumN protein n=1 Tax=Vibrio sagamiensis NBRC 104589 TaxID=1219064 RepID=A0A511QHM6_9VIBR|nr:TraB/GumN family protein [Vibrio sagamiensis]GEM76815.1 GumN protein [Vibrio sagamiensis NBRC 104589]